MNTTLEGKLKQLPTGPGVYFYKDQSGEIIYIGKAANLRNRVRQYFQASRVHEPKTDALVAEIVDLEFTSVETEIDALLLEAELIRRYLPRYNILLRDDKSNLYVRVAINDPHPTVSFTRRPLDDTAHYYGPFLNGHEIRRALTMLRRIFPYSTHTNAIPKRACLQYHLGLCPGIEENKTSLEAYRINLHKLTRYLEGKRTQLISNLEKEMKTAAKQQEFERAVAIRNQLFSLRALRQRSLFYDNDTHDISQDRGLQGLADLLGLIEPPRRIEGYDISHMQGTDTVASMVVFKNGFPDKVSYRKFKLRIPGNNDFAHIEEVITRRLDDKHRKDWGLPDLFLIDGGRGQLSSAIIGRDKYAIERPMIGLAKREEEIIIHRNTSAVTIDNETLHKHNALVKTSDDFISILLPKNSDIVKLLQRIRDESHRFAVSYHTTLKGKRQTASVFDTIPGVGPITKKKLLRTFGSKKAVIEAPLDELKLVIGPKIAAVIKSYLE